MLDMLVTLRSVPDATAITSQLRHQSIELRKPLGPELRQMEDGVKNTFSRRWSSECLQACTNTPVSCLIATHQRKAVGFCCYDATARGMLGPLGVDEAYRGKQIGTALLLSCLHDMRTQGYEYAVIGGVSSAEFYIKTVNALEIPHTESGLYDKLLLETP